MLLYTSQPFCGSGCKEKSKRPFFRGCFDGMVIPVLLLRQGWLTPWPRLARRFTLCRTEWFWHAWGLTTQKRGIWLMRIPGRVVRQHIYWHLLSFTIFGCRSCFPVMCLPQIFHPTWMLLHVSVCAKVAKLESNKEKKKTWRPKRTCHTSEIRDTVVGFQHLPIVAYLLIFYSLVSTIFTNVGRRCE